MSSTPGAGAADAADAAAVGAAPAATGAAVGAAVATPAAAGAAVGAAMDVRAAPTTVLGAIVWQAPSMPIRPLNAMRNPNLESVVSKTGPYKSVVTSRRVGTRKRAREPWCRANSGN